MATTPKLDMKMLAMPAMLLLSRKIAFTRPNPDYVCDEDGTCPDVALIPKELNNEDIIEKAQMGMICVAVLMMTMFYYIYNKAKSSVDGKKKIWVPPKPKPTLPFGMGPAPEAITLDDFKETSLGDHEADLVKEQAQSLIFPIGIAFFMSLKFNVHVSLLMQAVMLPINCFSDSGVVKKYILGKKDNGESDTMYNELYSKPTIDDVKAYNDKQAADSAPTTETPAVEDNKDNSAGKDEPRVVELDDDEEVKKTENKKDK
jgi:hypothetical protein